LNVQLPHPLLGYAIDETLSHEDAGGRHHHTSGTLLRDGNETLTFRANLNATHTARPPKPPHPAEPHVAIPGTPWHHTQHWLTGSAAPGDGHRDQGRTGDGPDWFHALTWRVRSLSEGVPTQRNWLVLADGGCNPAWVAAMYAPPLPTGMWRCFEPPPPSP